MVNNEDMLSEEDKSKFWSLVAACLVEIFNYDFLLALREVSLLRSHMEGSEDDFGDIGDIIYHIEPLDYAYGIEKWSEETRWSFDHQLKYQELRKSHYA